MRTLREQLLRARHECNFINPDYYTEDELAERKRILWRVIQFWGETIRKEARTQIDYLKLKCAEGQTTKIMVPYLNGMIYDEVLFNTLTDKFEEIHAWIQVEGRDREIAIIPLPKNLQ